MTLPHNLDVGFDRFETLIRLHRDTQSEPHLESYLAFALAAGLNTDDMANLSERVSEIIEYEEYRHLAEGVVLGVVIACLSAQEAKLGF